MLTIHLYLSKMLEMKGLLVLALAQPHKVLEAGGEAADVLTRTVLGSLVVLLMISCGWLIRMLVKAKNEHIKDKGDTTETLTAQIVGFKQMIADTNKSYDAVAAALAANTKATHNLAKRIEAHALSCPNLDQSKYLSAKGGGS
jgi:hypothetical protein